MDMRIVSTNPNMYDLIMIMALFQNAFNLPLPRKLFKCASRRGTGLPLVKDTINYSSLGGILQAGWWTQMSFNSNNQQ